MEGYKPLPLPSSKCNKIVSLLRCATKKKVIVVVGPTGCGGGACSWNLLLAVCILALGLSAQLCQAAPPALATTNETSWPPMRHYDIWNADLRASTAEQHMQMETELFEEQEVLDEEEEEEEEQLLLQDFSSSLNNISSSSNSSRRAKVIHLFPVPVDGECLSDDGRRLGNCFNAYECRQKGGQAKGECAMGFGVCCVFVATCNGTITNNITYIVSPEFPSFMPSNFSGCQLKVRMMSEDISQLRIDFYHFSLGQPNRRTGFCDGDVFSISGGPSGRFQLCGQNSGQHLYYDVGGRTLPRQSTLYGSLRPTPTANRSGLNGVDQLVEINLNLSTRFLPIRLWEMRVAQIPFSQRAPAGCLQYHTGQEGVLQTFNFADNGRHLANQHYRICVRQESDMCSIIYQPCDEQSFRIGGGGGGGSFMSSMNTVGSSSTSNPTTTTPSTTTSSSTASTTAATSTTTTVAAVTPTSSTTTTTEISFLQLLSNLANKTSTPDPDEMMTSNATTAATVAADNADNSGSGGNGGNGGSSGGSSNGSEGSSSAPATMTTTARPVRASTTSAPEQDDDEEPANDDVEGSGGDEGVFHIFGGGNKATTTALPGVSRRPRPVGGTSGGFDLLGFLRSAFDLRRRHRRHQRRARQFFSTCTDRITMPCIIEDFIGTGLGPLPGCEPVHCGAQFCSSGVWPCRIESTVTPFYIGIHFGDGSAAGKGSAEDNIGACLRYSQVQCI